MEPPGLEHGSMSMRTTASVILVREWEQQMSGSGCCGRLEGDFAFCAEGRVFAERREIIEGMGHVYRVVRERFGDAVDLQIVDPRNVSLLLLLVRDFWRFRVGLSTALGTLFRLPKQAVLVNGLIVDRSGRPDPEQVAAVVAKSVEHARVPARS